MSRKLTVALSLAFFFAGVGAHLFGGEASKADSADLRAVLQIEVFRLSGEVLGQMDFLDEAGLPDADSLAVRRFKSASLLIGIHQLMVAKERWSFNGTADVPDDQWITRIAAPRITIPLGQRFVVSASPEEGAEYFDRRADGLFELKRVGERTGIRLESRVSSLDGDNIRLEDFSISLTLIESRAAVDGVVMDVGRPELKTLEYHVALDMTPGENQGLLISTGGHGFLLVRLQADLR